MTMIAVDLESRVRALETEVAQLKERLEESEIDAAVRKSQDQFDRGEGIPLRQAMEAMRRKYNIPAR
jgi:hypothetical protein